MLQEFFPVTEIVHFFLPFFYILFPILTRWRQGQLYSLQPDLFCIEASFFVPDALQGLPFSPGLIGKALPALQFPFPPPAVMRSSGKGKE